LNFREFSIYECKTEVFKILTFPIHLVFCDWKLHRWYYRKGVYCDYFRKNAEQKIWT